MFISCLTPEIDRVFVYWYGILKIKYVMVMTSVIIKYYGHEQWPAVISCQTLEQDYLHIQPTLAVVKITVKSWELLTKKVTENDILSEHFIIFYRSNDVWPLMFYFFKELQVFLFLFIPFLYFVSLFIKEWIQRLAFFLFLLIHFLYFVSFYKRMHSMACLPTHQTPAHQTLNILMPLMTTYNNI